MKKIDKRFTKVMRSIIMIALLAVAMAYAACGSQKVNFTVEVTSSDGTTKTVNAKANKVEGLTVYDALKDGKYVKIDGSQSDWGYYLTTINGEEANYDVDGSYWSFYINGDYAQTGIDATVVEEGAVYSFIYTIFEGN